MPEIAIAGANEMTFPALSTWGWEIASYLFLGGLAAGLMILGGVFRLSGGRRFQRATLVADLAALPVLGIGMLLLFMDLSSKQNVWRLYATFQVTSPMSWGSWILLVTMVLLAVLFVSPLPAPRPTALFGMKLFPPAPTAREAKKAAKRGKQPAEERSSIVLLVERAWTLLYPIARLPQRYARPVAAAGIVLGVGVGIYTGVLLSSIQARPLWDSPLLAPLFLTSGLAGGGAFLCLFIGEEEHRRLVPFSISICVVELALILTYCLALASGSPAARNAAGLLFGGAFGLLFFGVVVLLGLVLPALVEGLEVMHRRVMLVPARVPPVLKLAGGATLRFVVVHAGMRSFV